MKNKYVGGGHLALIQSTETSLFSDGHFCDDNLATNNDKIVSTTFFAGRSISIAHKIVVMDRTYSRAKKDKHLLLCRKKTCVLNNDCKYTVVLYYKAHAVAGIH